MFIIFFLTVALETSYLRMYWTDLHHIFRIGRHKVGHDQSDLFSWSFKGCYYGNWFWHESAKIGIPIFILCAGIPQMGRSQRNMDALVISLTSDESLVNFGPVIPEFCRRVSTGRATRWASPRI